MKVNNFGLDIILTEENVNKIIESDPFLQKLTSIDQPYEIKLLTIINAPFFRNPIKKKATRREELDKEGTAVAGFYKYSSV